MDNKCNLTTCRYNKSGTCINERKRSECIEVSKKVLCLTSEEKQDDFYIQIQNLSK